MPTEYEVGVLVGLLVGEGHFGGDGRQPQVTLRMHVRHEALFRWLERTFPGGRLYGPYQHGGRSYFQWMLRGTYLRDEILPAIGHRIGPQLDEYTAGRLQQMRDRYASRLEGSASNPASASMEAPGAVNPAISPRPATAELDQLFDRLRDRPTS